MVPVSGMGRKSREKRERRRKRLAEERAARPAQRYPANTEYVPPADPVTPSEGYLRKLCKRTFLSLWSYPNPFRDQAGGAQDGKEICDLLVVFENDVIIFSDKHCEFPNSADLDLDWARWYRRAVEKSARQLVGCRTVDPDSPRQGLLGHTMHQEVPTVTSRADDHFSSRSCSTWGGCPLRPGAGRKWESDVELHIDRVPPYDAKRRGCTFRGWPSGFHTRIRARSRRYDLGNTVRDVRYGG